MEYHYAVTAAYKKKTPLPVHEHIIFAPDKTGRGGMGQDGMGQDGMGQDGMERTAMGWDGMNRDGMKRAVT